jgi:hypothetical protein
MRYIAADSGDRHLGLTHLGSISFVMLAHYIHDARAIHMNVNNVRCNATEITQHTEHSACNVHVPVYIQVYVRTLFETIAWECVSRCMFHNVFIQCCYYVNHQCHNNMLCVLKQAWVEFLRRSVSCSVKNPCPISFSPDTCFRLSYETVYHCKLGVSTLL